jgi:hypothetical protein
MLEVKVSGRVRDGKRKTCRAEDQNAAKLFSSTRHHAAARATVTIPR